MMRFALERFHGDNLDVRIDPRMGDLVSTFLRGWAVKRVIVADGIIGCPHEEGIDYPEDQECPTCIFWQGKDRFENAKPND
ncbi:MAG: hypothetical protein ACRENP_08925 [Longimicrobiales bacterium]